MLTALNAINAPAIGLAPSKESNYAEGCNIAQYGSVKVGN